MPPGSTAGIQQFLRMQGLEYGDSAGHDYHLWFDGDKLYTDAQFVFGGASPWIDATRYGADGSGSADSAGAIQAALNAAAGTGLQGSPSTVFLPPGAFKIKSPIYVPLWVVLRGASGRGSLIIADSTFPTSTPLVSLGKLTDSGVYGCRVEDVTIDCNRVVGSVGVYSNQLNEMCGAKRVTVTRYMDKGFQIICQANIVGGYNWQIEDCGASGSDTGSGTYGFHISAGAAAFGYGKLTRCSVVPNGAGQTGQDGIYVGGAGEMGAALEDMHVENHVNGIHFDTNSLGTATWTTAGGASGTTNVVNIDTGRPVVLDGLRGTVITHLIVDTPNGVTIDGSRYGHYSNTELHANRVALRNSNTTQAPFNLPHGTAPTSPVDGDFWTTTAGLFVRINGVTVGPLS